jgi:hypothetical protein
MDLEPNSTEAVQALWDVYMLFSGRSDALALGDRDPNGNYPQPILSDAVNAALYHAFPDLESADIRRVLDESGESVAYCAALVREQEKASEFRMWES